MEERKNRAESGFDFLHVPVMARGWRARGDRILLLVSVGGEAGLCVNEGFIQEARKILVIITEESKIPWL